MKILKTLTKIGVCITPLSAAKYIEPKLVKTASGASLGKNVFSGLETGANLLGKGARWIGAENSAKNLEEAGKKLNGYNQKTQLVGRFASAVANNAQFVIDSKVGINASTLLKRNIVDPNLKDVEKEDGFVSLEKKTLFDKTWGYFQKEDELSDWEDLANEFKKDTLANDIYISPFEKIARDKEMNEAMDWEFVAAIEVPQKVK